MSSRIASLSNLLLSLPLATGLLCAAASASAQETASVTIPFGFSADNQHLDAGSYKVELLTDRFVSLRNTATNNTQILMVRPEVGTTIQPRSRLTFRQEGSRKYLTEVWIGGLSMHSEMAIRHKPQRNLGKKDTAPSTIQLALK